MSNNEVDRRIQTGHMGEVLAKEYLEKHGYDILELNWRCRSGEIDIIAKYNDILVFVEVRTRKSKERFGTASESVDHRKQKKVREIALIYLHFNGKHDHDLRFDVIAIALDDKNNVEILEHLLSAF